MLTLVLSSKVDADTNRNAESQRSHDINRAAKNLVLSIKQDPKSRSRGLIFFAPYKTNTRIPINPVTADSLFSDFEKGFVDYKKAEKRKLRNLKFIRYNNKKIRAHKDFKKIKYLITSELRLVNRNLTITFRAERDGGIIGIEKVRIKNLKSAEIEKRTKIAMSDAISEASEKFSDYGKRFSNTDNPMEKLYWNYLSQGERGYSTAFERMFMKELVVGIQENFTGFLSSRKLITKRVSNPQAKLKKGSFMLSGTSEMLEDSVVVYLNFGNKIQQELWSGIIDRNTTSNLPYSDSSNKAFLEELRKRDAKRGIDLELTTSSGPNPTLAIGETWNLQVSVDKPAWLYCYYHTADKQTIQMFPNPATWRENKGPRINPGKASVTLPVQNKESQYQATFKTSPPAGFELIKCYAATKDVTVILPQELTGKGDYKVMPALPERYSTSLSDTFLDRDDNVSEASLAITVINKH